MHTHPRNKEKERDNVFQFSMNDDHMHHFKV